MSWNFRDVTKSGAESALDACDYFVDEIIEPWKVPSGISERNCFLI